MRASEKEREREREPSKRRFVDFALFLFASAAFPVFLNVFLCLLACILAFPAFTQIMQLSRMGVEDRDTVLIALLKVNAKA